MTQIYVKNMLFLHIFETLTNHATIFVKFVQFVAVGNL